MLSRIVPKIEAKNLFHSANSPRPDEKECQPIVGNGLVAEQSDESGSALKDDTPFSSTEQDAPECVYLESASFSIADLSREDATTPSSYSNVPLHYILKKETSSDPLQAGYRYKLTNTRASSPSEAAAFC